MSLYIGTNYHPHDWPRERWSEDIRLMKEAGLDTVRMGHLAWDSFEPQDGIYTFEWFDEVMDLFHQAGIRVVLDISLRPAPVWVHRICPGCNISSKSGAVQESLHRYMEDVADPEYQFYAFRFARKMMEHFRSHPALMAFGLCNEVGSGMLSYSEYARRLAAESNTELMKWIVDYAVRDMDVGQRFHLPKGVQGRKIAENQYFFVNMNRYKVEFDIPSGGKGVLSEKEYQDRLSLDGYQCELIVEES